VWTLVRAALPEASPWYVVELVSYCFRLGPFRHMGCPALLAVTLGLVAAGDRVGYGWDPSLGADAQGGGARLSSLLNTARFSLQCVVMTRRRSRAGEGLRERVCRPTDLHPEAWIRFLIRITPGRLRQPPFMLQVARPRLATR